MKTGDIQRQLKSLRAEITEHAKKHPWLLLAAGVGGLLTGWLGRTRIPQLLTYITNSQRDDWFGPLRAIPFPQPGNPEAVLITNDFERENVITETFPILGTIRIHRAAAPSLHRIMSEIESKGWAYKIKTFDGSYVPRFVRGSDTSLSSHAFATSIDINARENGQGMPPTKDQEDLAPIFQKHGWYWGKNFTTKTDPMHFEYVLPPRGVI
jgi:D-alanyl-D-alanine carboxypeptidase